MHKSSAPSPVIQELRPHLYLLGIAGRLSATNLLNTPCETRGTSSLIPHADRVAPYTHYKATDRPQDSFVVFTAYATISKFIGYGAQ